MKNTFRETINAINHEFMERTEEFLTEKRVKKIREAYKRKFGEFTADDEHAYHTYEQDGLTYYCRNEVCFFIEESQGEMRFKEDGNGGFNMEFSRGYDDNPEGVFCFFLEDHLEVLRTKLTPAEAAEIIRTHLNNEPLD